MAKTILDLKGLKKIAVVDFTGGVNENSREYAVLPNELQSSQNMEIRKKGALVVRTGFEKYEASAEALNLPAVDQFYYVHRDGTRKMIMYSGGTALPVVTTRVYGDDDAGVYTELGGNGILESGDGHCRFAQYRDTLFFGAEGFSVSVVNTGLRSYNSDGDAIQTPGDDIRGIMDPVASFTQIMTITIGTTGGFLDKKHYVYRLCWEINHDTDFMGESYPVWNSLGTQDGEPGELSGDDVFSTKERREHIQVDVDNTASGTETNQAEFKKPASTPSGFPSTADKINIYRSGPYESFDSFSPQSTDRDDRFFLIGTVDGSTYSAASVGTVLFTDRGEITLGPQIRYFPTRVPPRPRFLTVHKDRLWIAYVVEVEPVSTDETIRAHRVYASEFREPYVYPQGSWADIQPNDGEGITGIVSWRNKIMLVFKNNSTYAVVGGDDVDFAGNPDITVEIISEDIGCIAPGSIVQAEGRIMWLSHRGVYYFDGTIPRPLKNVNVEDSLRAVDTGTDYDSSMGYFSLERELWIGHDVGTGLSNIQKFNFVTGAWSLHDNPVNTSSTSVASFVEKSAKNQRPEFYIGINANPAGLDALEVVYKAETSLFIDEGDTSLPWAFKTKAFEFGAPWSQKKIIAIGLDCNIPDTTGTTIRVFCDGRLDTSTDPGGNISITGAIVGHHLHMLDVRIRGKKVAFEISGIQTTGPTEFFGLVVYYKEEEGVIDE